MPVFFIFHRTHVADLEAKTLVQKMQLDVYFKDVTFETLNQADFLESVKAAFPRVDWDKTYGEFRAAGEVKRQE